MANPRKASLSISYKGTKLDKEISDRATSFTYTDVASGESDSISITLQNLDEKWINGWMPNKGDSISSSVIMENWNKAGDKKTLSCGKFTIDDLSFSGRPLLCNIGAVSVPAKDSFKATKKSKTWTNVTVKEIATEIAKDASITLYYEASSIKISEIEQSSETNSSFLYSLCQKYGLAMKVYNNKLVIFDEGKYEAKSKVATINESDMLSWSYNTTIDGSYTGAKISYSDPDSDNTITVQVGSSGRLYEFNSSVDSKYDAELQAAAKVNIANKSVTTMEISIPANTAIIASSVIEITGLGKLNGKYYVDKVKHSVGSGYKMQLSIHLIVKRIVATSIESANKVVATTASKGTSYTIVSGDTLWAIATKNYKSGSKYTVIYNANKDVIEAAAKAHGFKSSENGKWIFPGTVLTIPAL